MEDTGSIAIWTKRLLVEQLLYHVRLAISHEFHHIFILEAVCIYTHIKRINSVTENQKRNKSL